MGPEAWPDLKDVFGFDIVMPVVRDWRPHVGVDAWGFVPESEVAAWAARAREMAR